MMVRRFAVAAALASSAFVVAGSGGRVLLGLSLVGGLMASWGYVYARTVCAAAPFVWSQLLRTAGVGALAMPTITAIASLAGTAAWLLVGAAGSVWLVMVTPDGKAALPTRVRRWLHT
jgi:hypothetical protein